MAKSLIKYQTFPRTVAPPPFADKLVGAFRKNEPSISTSTLSKGLTSNAVLKHIKADLISIGFLVETGKGKEQKIRRPVLFGENGESIVNFEIDGYHPEWQVILEIEAARAWMGNAVFRDLIRACVMVQVKFLALAVPMAYRYSRLKGKVANPDYDNTKDLLEVLYKQENFRLPYGTILIGY